ncbi:MAG: hypothetical protein NT031_07880 [Planctomycetota bacterium]|nr:hypothetical protein [Planctomycetota bacterium]
MVKPNFNFQKRQKEAAKKKKQEQKRLLKQAGHRADPADPSAEATDGPSPV